MTQAEHSQLLAMRATIISLLHQVDAMLQSEQPSGETDSCKLGQHPPHMVENVTTMGQPNKLYCRACETFFDGRPT